MTTLPATVKYHPQLPAYLQDQALFDDTDKAIAGIGGGQPPYISIKASKWRLVGADGEEAMVNQLHLDVVVIAGNEHLSKTYYADAYDPSGAPVPPTCFSDNGSAPSSQASSPQSALCASCPHNAWGSKVSEVTGKDLKACTDSKKLAVVLATDTPILVNGVAGIAKAYEQVYLLRVPAASMAGWKAYAKSVRDRGVPIIGVVTRLTFDANTSYPALVYAAVSFVPNEQAFKALCAKRDEPATAEAVGANDRPLLSGQPQQPPATSALPLQAPAFIAPPALAAAAAPLPTPPAVSPIPTTPPPAAPSAAPAAATSGTRPRGRPRANAAASSPAPAAPGPAVPAAAPLFAPMATAAPAGNGAVIQQPAATDASLDALLAQTFAPQA